MASTETVANIKVTAYPNPSSNLFTIEVQNAVSTQTNVQVYDMQGQIVESLQAKSNSIELGSNYKKGIYNVIVENNGQTKMVRLIKE
jgi:uncharacterized protein YaeQ